MASTSELPEAWRRGLEAVAHELGADEARPLEGGVWRVDFMCALGTSGRVLGLLPGAFRRIAEEWEELCDEYGEGVDYASESGTFACDEARAVFEFVDHWQAGLSGSVAVYPDEASYRAALAPHLDEDGAG